MSTCPTPGLRPLVREDWERIVIRYATVIAAPPVKRRHPRYDTTGRAKLSKAGSQAVLVETCALLQVSAEGLTLRSHDEIPLHELLAIEVRLTDRAVLLHGRVVHCTGTVGGYKLGVLLTFDESPSVEQAAPATRATQQTSLPRLRRLIMANMNSRPRNPR